MDIHLAVVPSTTIIIRSFKILLLRRFRISVWGSTYTLVCQLWLSFVLRWPAIVQFLFPNPPPPMFVCDEPTAASIFMSSMWLSFRLCFTSACQVIDWQCLRHREQTIPLRSSVAVIQGKSSFNDGSISVCFVFDCRLFKHTRGKHVLCKHGRYVWAQSLPHLFLPLCVCATRHPMHNVSQTFSNWVDFQSSTLTTVSEVLLPHVCSSQVYQRK